ncbi:hypothetical protein CRE_02906 [Caenorhabditis remanei]|uniref:Uncharacterized protein n=1 Tax=Caenorhabditis remanei TaxID=31234 RepID=E3LWL8_CAERE|nr:hypothetical protein CRE_02906 [Caenorhabditis remanei]
MTTSVDGGKRSINGAPEDHGAVLKPGIYSSGNEAVKSENIMVGSNAISISLDLASNVEDVTMVADGIALELAIVANETVIGKNGNGTMVSSGNVSSSSRENQAMRGASPPFRSVHQLEMVRNHLSYKTQKKTCAEVRGKSSETETHLVWQPRRTIQIVTTLPETEEDENVHLAENNDCDRFTNLIARKQKANNEDYY